jgi:hypothetical protein
MGRIGRSVDRLSAQLAPSSGEETPRIVHDREDEADAVLRGQQPLEQRTGLGKIALQERGIGRIGGAGGGWSDGCVDGHAITLADEHQRDVMAR